MNLEPSTMSYFRKNIYQRVSAALFPVLMLLILLLLAAGAWPALAEQPAQQEQSVPAFITIATGPLNGLYYPAGRAICRIVNSDRNLPHPLCSVERTSGSIYNLKALAAGEVEFCISQSDQISAAYAGTGEFKDELQGLRIVFPLFEESFTVVVRADSPIRRISDLKHRIVSTGLPGSGGYATLRAIMRSMEWDFYDIKQVDTISNAKALARLCDKTLDAVVFTAGHPYPPLARACEKCVLRLLRVRGAAVSRLLASSGAYSRTTIPGGFYRGINRPVKTIGVVATLVSSSSVDGKLVYRVLKTLNDHIEIFRQARPVFGRVTREEIFREQMAAPVHAGAERYLHEISLKAEDQIQDNGQ